VVLVSAQLSDNLGNSVMHEACKGAHDGVIGILKDHGAQYAPPPPAVTCDPCAPEVADASAALLHCSVLCIQGTLWRGPDH
jgi:hypothetical protein